MARESKRLCARSMDLPKGANGLEVDADGVPVKASQFRWLTPEFRQMVMEADRWGEAYFYWLSNDSLACAWPIHHNQSVIGGWIVMLPDAEDDWAIGNDDLDSVECMVSRITAVLIEENLLNAARMREQQTAASRERMRAEAIHSLKDGPLEQIRDVYLKLEPELFMAMRRGHRNEARRLLNQVLMGIYSLGNQDLGRIKGYLLDLLTAMCRTMVDCGADPAETLGRNFNSLHELSGIHGEEDLSHWLADVLERMIDGMAHFQGEDPRLRIQLMLNYLREHCAEPLGRDEVAAKLGISPTHFSRTLKAYTGMTFSEQLSRIRMEKASTLLRQSKWGLLAVAAECGFTDQSYFTKVFKRHFGTTPAHYRKLLRA